MKQIRLMAAVLEWVSLKAPLINEFCEEEVSPPTTRIPVASCFSISPRGGRVSGSFLEEKENMKHNTFSLDLVCTSSEKKLQPTKLTWS